MKRDLTRSELLGRLRSAYASPESTLAAMSDPVIPDDLSDWLSRLALLYGVPFNYLVPDEAMLPPESIRFFHLDPNWTDALTDGAFSIGRNLTADTNNAALTRDAAVRGLATEKVNTHKPGIRAAHFGLKAGQPPATITGFLLRSSLVLDYPSLGVNAYPLGGTPDDPQPSMLDLLRLEQLGPKSDTLICLITGDAYRIDIHEAPQVLHYGIDCYDDDCEVDETPALAVKNLHTFSISSSTDPDTGTKQQSVTMSDTVTPTDISSAIRTNGTRTVEMTTLADLISTANDGAVVDSAIMGFEMTEGVGMVSFFKAATT